jgi:hypothetical protein
MNDQSYNGPRLDETPAVDIINVSYCIGRMGVPIRRGTGPPFRSTRSQSSTDQSGSGKSTMIVRR